VKFNLFCLLLKPTFGALSSSAAAAAAAVGNVKQHLLSCPEALHQHTDNSVRQRHSADMVRKSRKTHSVSSRFADVLSLECSQQQLSRPVKVDRRTLPSAAVPGALVASTAQLPAVDNASSTASCTSFDLMRTTVAAGSSLILTSPSLRQLSFAADDISGLLVVSGSRCESSVNIVDSPLSPWQSGVMRTPGDFPSSLLLAPIPAPSRQLQPHRTDPHRVSGSLQPHCYCHCYI